MVGVGRLAVLPGIVAACRASLKGSRAGDAAAEDTVGVGELAVVPVVSSTCRASVEGSRVDGAVAEDGIRWGSSLTGPRKRYSVHIRPVRLARTPGMKTKGCARSVAHTAGTPSRGRSPRCN